MRPRLLHEALIEAAKREPAKTALVVEGERFSYSDLQKSSRRLAQVLRARGLQRCDRVIIYMENTWAAVVAVYGTLWAGGAMVMVNPQTPPDKLAFICDDADAAAILTSSELWSRVSSRLKGRPPVVLIENAASQVGGKEERIEDLDNALSAIPDGDPAYRDVPIATDLAALIYTSGSTGEPKGVMHTHQSMSFAVDSVSEYLRLARDDRIVNVLPLSFDYGLYQLLMSVQLGATLLLERSFAYPAKVLQLLERERATVFPAVPTLFSMLRTIHRRNPLCFPHVRRVTNTAAALPSGFISDIGAIFPRALIYAMYGLTECKRVCYLPPDKLLDKPDSVGQAIPGTEAIVLSERGEPIEPGETGTLHVRGPHVMLGYWRRPELTAEMIRPGAWEGDRVLCTHDRFTIDEDGDLYFIGRTDDIIKSRGEKVSPAEVEAVLYGADGVKDVAVVGLPDPILGESIAAFVSLTDNDGSVDGTTLRRVCANHLENHMVPQRISILDELPRTANGKIDKGRLVATAQSPVATAKERSAMRGTFGRTVAGGRATGGTVVEG